MNAAQGCEAGETFLVDMRHDDPNLVHVGGKHDFHPAGTLLAFASDQVAQGIDPHLVGVRFDLSANGCADLGFVPGGAGGFDELLDQRFHKISCDTR